MIRKLLIATCVVLALPLVSFAWRQPAGGTTNASEELARSTAMLFRSARLVISDSQPEINDANVGDKGLTGAAVIQRAKENYTKVAGTPLPEIDDSRFGRVQKCMFEAIEAVMAEAQPLINEKGKAFKGFIPAVFAKRVADRFTKTIEGTVVVKLTAPKDLVRNRANRPDEWESGVLEQRFKSKDWRRGNGFGETADYKGKAGYRLMIPEYYSASCLGCHGGPKGELDITGGQKEGAKLDDLGGAISVTILD